jgi:hypothetical protein
MFRKYLRPLFVFFLAGAILNACAATDLANTWIDKNYQGRPVTDILVIAVTLEESVRRSFETKFVEQLTAAGVEAVSSANVISVPADQKIEKDVILQAVNKFGNDAVLITHLVAVEKKQVYHPPRFSRGYYGYYGYVHRAVYSPGYYVTHTLVRLETTLYDVKSEHPIWSGQSESWNPNSDKQIIGEVIPLVIKDLKENGILPAR